MGGNHQHTLNSDGGVHDPAFKPSYRLRPPLLLRELPLPPPLPRVVLPLVEDLLPFSLEPLEPLLRTRGVVLAPESSRLVRVCVRGATRGVCRG